MESRTTLEKCWRFMRRYNRYIKVSLISLMAIVIALLPTEMFGIEGLNGIQQRVIAIFLWAACMWIVEAVPAWTTSLLIIVIMLLTVSDSAISPLISGYEKSDLMSYKVIMNTFANPTVMLFMGGFILALVASKSGVDVSMARAMLKPFGSKPSVLLFGFMLVTAIFSMFVSNTATAAMMLTFLAPVLRQLPPSEKGMAALALAIPIGANVGGLATPIGTPPNGIALQYINGELGLGVDFGEWMMLMAPLMFVILVLSWVLLRFLYPFTAKKVNMHIIGGAKKGWRTYVIYGTLAVTILLWMFEKVTGINSYVVALLPIGVFAITRIIKSSDLKDIDWACLWMVAGGFALGEGMSKTGLADNLVKAIPFDSWPAIVVLIGGGFICWLLSQFISNSAATALIVPIMVAVGKGIEGPLGEYGGIGTLLVGVAMSASFAMSLPISTPPNAIAYSTGLIKTKQMFVTGMTVGVISLVVGYVLIVVVGRMGYFG